MRANWSGVGYLAVLVLSSVFLTLMTPLLWQPSKDRAKAGAIGTGIMCVVVPEYCGRQSFRPVPVRVSEATSDDELGG